MKSIIVKPLAIAILAGTAVAAHADVLLNTFGNTGAGFEPNLSLVVSVDQYMARPFTVSSDYTLSEIDIALVFLTEDTSIDISVCEDNGGTPGTVLETFAVLHGSIESDGVVKNLQSTLNPLLTAGNTYYVTMIPSDPDADGGWSLANDFHDAPLVFSQDQGATWNSSINNDGAIMIQGNLVVPEPASLAILGLGVFGLLRRRR